MVPIADIDSDTGLFLGLAWLTTVACVIAGVIALAAQVAGRERARTLVLRVFYVLLASAAISLAGLFLSV